MHFQLLAILTIAGTGRLLAGPVLLEVQLVPSVASFTAGQIITVDTLISGVAATGATEVGSFDVSIGFDSDLVAPLSVRFSPLLGDPLLFEALTDFILLPHEVEMAEVSLLTNTELQALQLDSFNLVTISFQALQDGASNFFLGGPIDDGNGILIGGTKQAVVPEAGGCVLLAVGISAVFVWRKKWAGQASLCLLITAGVVRAQQTGDGIVPVLTRAPAGVATPDSARLDREVNKFIPLPIQKVGLTGGPRHQPSIAVNPLNNDQYVIGVNDYTLSENGSCSAFYSTDSAQTWTIADGGPFPTLADYTFSGSPSVAFDHQNNVYFSCLNHNRLKPLPSAIYVFKSTNGGPSVVPGSVFGAPQPVAFGVPGISILEKPYLTTDWFNNKVYVTWTRSKLADGTSNIMFAGSSDGGASFVSPAPHVMSHPSHSRSHDSVPAAGSVANHVYVAWEDSTRPSILINKSINGGANFVFGNDVVAADQIVPFSSQPLAAFPGTYPALRGEHGYFRVNSKPSINVCRKSLHPYSGHVYLTWADNRNGDGDIFFVKSTDGGLNWSIPKRVNDDTLGNGKDQFFPWLAVDEQCRIYIGFYDRRNDPANQKFHVYVTDSEDGGLSFSKNTRVTTAPSTNINFDGQYIGDHIGLAATDNAMGTFHHKERRRSVPVWMDSTLGPNRQ